MTELLRYEQWSRLVEELSKDSGLDHEIVYYIDDNRKIRREEWSKDGRYHREDGPARIYYYRNGNIEHKAWYRDGKQHREDGPAGIGYDQDSTIQREGWYINDKLHREDGPARIVYHSNGKIKSEQYYIDGEEITGQKLKIMKSRIKYERSMREMGLEGLL
jgi:antitoxin component YwqK of YwqJK toxin-antitoxin module